MSRIQLLPDAVASQVAAGEVVERPASAVKELVENSLDAGARSIEVAIRGGGATLLRVIDDGHGMDRDDALLCLERHATSKIRTGADLAAIRTLGFRGEALPAIASVSHFRLTTREASALAGTEVLVNGGKIATVREAGAPAGTDIEVRSLFYNLPARRKFLRAATTEAAHIEHALRLLAIGHPAVRFVHRRDERVVFQLPPAARLLDRLRDLCGNAVVEELLPVADLVTRGDGESSGGLRKIDGFIGKAGVSRANRADQIVFVNGRPVENVALSQALREGYHTALMKGRHPLTFLFLEIDPAAVDVNVHPAKREVRFREPRQIREALVSAVRRTLESARADWSRSFHQPSLPASSATVAPPPVANLASTASASAAPDAALPFLDAELADEISPAPLPALSAPPTHSTEHFYQK
ncbi:MAG: DNA mismatch repair endonuclease MutL, partial [Verrucomicrobia bacterium]|nr:DNA mismatch repair endonuclease MutL [Verrucomicrobiota bacterium]